MHKFIPKNITSTSIFLSLGSWITLTVLIVFISTTALATETANNKLLSQWSGAVCRDLGCMSLGSTRMGVNLSALGMVQDKSVLEGYGFSFGEGPYRITATRIDTGRYRVTIQSMGRQNDNDKNLIRLNTQADTLYPVSIQKAPAGKYMWNAAIQFDMEDQLGIVPDSEMEQKPVSFVNFRIIDPVKFNALVFTGSGNKTTTQMVYKGNHTWKLNFGNGSLMYQNGKWSANGAAAAASSPQATKTASSKSEVNVTAQESSSSQDLEITENTLVFLKADATDMTHNNDPIEWEVFKGQVNHSFYYLVKNSEIGTAMIDVEKGAMFDAQTAQPLPGNDGMALDMNDVTLLDSSGAKLAVNQSKTIVTAWWDKDTLSFTLENNPQPLAQTDQTEELSAPATIEEPANPQQELSDPALLFANSDFEMGDLTNWTAEGNAFDFQPTKGDNPTARGRKSQPSQHQGDFWIGTFEKYQGAAKQRPGKTQGDKPTGTLTSVTFEIKGDKISFLVGGGKSKDREMVSLLVDGQGVFQAMGKRKETLQPVVWDVSAYKGKNAQIIIKDAHPGGWGHINADDFRYAGVN
jgi:hypothetical protein